MRVCTVWHTGKPTITGHVAGAWQTRVALRNHALDGVVHNQWRHLANTMDRSMRRRRCVSILSLPISQHLANNFILLLKAAILNGRQSMCRSTKRLADYATIVVEYYSYTYHSMRKCGTRNGRCSRFAPVNSSNDNKDTTQAVTSLRSVPA